MNLESRVKAAYEKFKQEVSSDIHDKFLQLIEKIHSDAWDVVEGKNSGLAQSEFSHALSIISSETAHRGALPLDKNELPTRVEKDGTLLGVGKWETLDPGWIESLIGWLEHLENRAPFNTNPATVIIPNDVDLCIAGDWGTGYWRTKPLSPAENVCNAMQVLQPDITIHLGDVYYAGTAEQEKENLVNIWPNGSLGSFTLNSNHEMYNGAISYFNALETHFKKQKGCSYFALENDDWLVIGLDSAYDSDKWKLYMEGKIGEAQRAWLQALPAKKRIIILSHHNGYDLKGKAEQPLYSEVLNQLRGDNDTLRYSEIFWYWGHLHNVASYKSKQFLGAKIHTRCIGHAAIPYGDASELSETDEVLWYETKSADDPNIPVRVMNGFAHLQFRGEKLQEILIAEDGSTRWESGIKGKT